MDHDETTGTPETTTHILVETRPQRLIAARYDDMPFPNIGPVQEVAFDVGVTARNGAVDLVGLVVKGYNDHQMLFEQRWPARIIQARVGEPNLRIEPGTGIAVRALHFMLHAYEPLTRVELTVVAKRVEDGETVQGIVNLPVVYPERRTDLHFPVRGAWWLINGSDWSDRHKIEVFSQTYAMDFVKLGPDNGFFQGTGMALEDHHSWNQPVYATAGGKIAYICYDLPDLMPGSPPDPRMFHEDPRRTLGNAVVISHGNGEFSFYGSLQQASLQVNEGQMVKRGTLLGRVGNSGHSPGPHLHFMLLEGPNPFIDQGLPVRFSHFRAGGQTFTEPTPIPSRMIVFSTTEEE